jgi:hypothetical protein
VIGSAASHGVAWLATREDPDVRPAVGGALVENLDEAPPVVEASQTPLGKASRPLYDTWLG